MNRPLAVSLALLLCLPAMPLTAEECGSILDSVAAEVSRASPAVFTNATSAAGLAGLVGDSYAWGDYNNDGCDDLLVKGSRLFKNNGPPKYDFTEVTQQAGIGGGYGYAVWGDYNNDGNLDFFCAGQDERTLDTLWRNAGPPDYAFVNASTEAGGVDDGLSPSIAASWLDYDRDSYLDVYVVNWRIGSAPNFEDVLWHNNGDGTFTNVTRTAGIQDFNPPYAAMGATSADYNNDGWPDIYIGNYLLAPNYLWHNDHDGTFTNLGFEANVSGDPKYYIDGSGPYYGHTAGSCWGDYNNDGLLDLWVGNLAHKDMGTTQRALICDNPMLMKNLGFPYRFEDFKERSGMPNIPNGDILDQQWHDDDTFGGAWCDFDNDGWLDLYVPQVKGYHSWAYAQLWHNSGDGTFTEVGGDANVRVWAGIGCAWADYNNDGQPDQVTEGTYPYQGPREAHLFKNQGTANHWLKVILKGVESNRAAIGARLAAYDGTMTQIREVEGGTGGHAHQNSLTQMLGFGSHSGTVSVEIRWPSGIVQNVTGIALDQTVTITEDASGPRILSVSASSLSPAAGESVTFSCTVRGSPSAVMWDFEGDGKFDAFLSSNQPVSFTYDRGARNYPAVRIMDAAGRLGEQESLVLHSRNLVPASRSGGDRVANETEPVLFDGSGSTDTPSDLPNLTYNWTFNDGCVTGWQRSPRLLRSFDQAGTYYGTLGVRDPEGATANDSFTVRILNVPPTVRINMSARAVEDTPLDFNAAGNDTAPDRPFLKYLWDFGDGSASPWLSSPRTSHTYTVSGNYSVNLTIKDDDGAKGYDSLLVDVADTAPIASVEQESIVANEDSPLTLAGRGADTESDARGLAFRWDFGDGNSSDWGPEPSATHAYARKGNYTATFSVRDDAGGVASASVNVTVRNLPPSCSISTRGQEVAEDFEVEFSASGKDTPSDLPFLTYSWDFGDGNVTAWSADPAALHSYARKGDYTAILTAQDDDGALAKASVDISVSNLPPVAHAKASKSTVDEDAPVSFNASASGDTPSDLPLLTFSWDFGDGSEGEGMTVAHGYSRQRTYKVALTVTDDDGEMATAELSVKVNNVEPWVNAFSDRIRVPVGKPVGFSAEGGDTPGDNATLKFEWDFGDRMTARGQNASHDYSQAGTFIAKARVTDDNGASAEDSISIEVYETPAEGGSASSGPSMALMAGVAGVAAAAAIVGILLLLWTRKGGGRTAPGGRKPERATMMVQRGGGGMAPPAGEKTDRPTMIVRREGGGNAASGVEEPGDATMIMPVEGGGGAAPAAEGLDGAAMLAPKEPGTDAEGKGGGG